MITTKRAGRGRPRKYDRAARAVTVTLPEDVLDSLAGVDPDLGRAIVRLAERRRTTPPPAAAPAELASYGNYAVIVVTPGIALRKLAGVQLVPVGNGRALISLQPPYSIAQLELSLRDAMERRQLNERDQQAFKAIADILSGARRASGVRLEERTIIVLQPARRHHGRSAPGRANATRRRA